MRFANAWLRVQFRLSPSNLIKIINMRTNSYSKDFMRRKEYKKLESCKIIIKALIKIGKNKLSKKELFFLYRLLYIYMEY